MRKLTLTLIVISLCAFPALSSAQDDCPPGDPYCENPPTVPGGNGPGGSPTDPGAAPGTVPGTSSGTASGTAGAAGVTGTGTSSSGALTEAQAARAGTGVDTGQLPATGFDETAAMALLGALLVGSGLLIRRRALAGD